MFGEPEQSFHWHGPEPPMRVPAANWGVNPYEHTPPFSEATGVCDAECEACLWNRARHLKQREDLCMPPATVILTEYDKLFMKMANISWEGDKR